jgi:hypothetical protein
MTFAPAAAQRIGQAVAASPNGGYGANRYHFDTYQIDRGAARERFAAYMTRFDIATAKDTTEGTPRSNWAAPLLRHPPEYLPSERS